MILRRLNMDSSWYLRHGEAAFLVDPWLVGSEIDGFRWLNEQWHVVDPVPIEELPAYDFILITQSYEDHCHLETLRRLDADRPILATAKAYRRLHRAFPQRDVRLVPHRGGGCPWPAGGLSLRAFRPDKWIDPIYFAVCLSDSEGQTLFYAPHGFALDEAQLASLEGQAVRLLLTTFTDFRIPAILGGRVNPGTEGAARLCAQLQPQWVVNTHDEPKRMQGLVARFARVAYPDYEALDREAAYPFLRISDYGEVQI